MDDKMQRWQQYGDYFLPHTRLVIALTCAALAMMLVLYGLPVALFPLLATVFLLWDYCRNNGIWIAFRAFRQGNLPRMRRALAEVRWPNLLSARSKAYHQWMQGVIQAAEGRFQAARVHLLIAAAGELRTENDRSLVQCLLAEMAWQAGDSQAAQEHLALAAALAHHQDVGRIINNLRRRIEQGSD